MAFHASGTRLPRLSMYKHCTYAVSAHSLLKVGMSFNGRYRIEQELGTEIKPIPPTIEKSLYCS